MLLSNRIAAKERELSARRNPKEHSNQKLKHFAKI